MSDLKEYLKRLANSKPIETPTRDYYSHIAIPIEKLDDVLRILKEKEPFNQVFKDVSGLKELGTPEGPWSKLLPGGRVGVFTRNGLTLLNYVFNRDELAEKKLLLELEGSVGQLGQGLMYSNFGIGYEVPSRKGIAKIPLGDILGYLGTFSLFTTDRKNVDSVAVSGLVKRLNKILEASRPVVNFKSASDSTMYEVCLEVVNLSPIVERKSRSPPKYAAVFDPPDELCEHYFGQVKDPCKIPYLIMTLHRQDNVVGPVRVLPETDPLKQRDMIIQRDTIATTLKQVLQ